MVHNIFNILKISRKKERKNSIKKCMVFKPSFKCFKNKKIIFIQAILNLETYIYLLGGFKHSIVYLNK